MSSAFLRPVRYSRSIRSETNVFPGKRIVLDAVDEPGHEGAKSKMATTTHTGPDLSPTKPTSGSKTWARGT